MRATGLTVYPWLYSSELVVVESPTVASVMPQSAVQI